MNHAKQQRARTVPATQRNRTRLGLVSSEHRPTHHSASSSIWYAEVVGFSYQLGPFEGTESEARAFFTSMYGLVIRMFNAVLL